MARLSQVFRQAAESRIITNAHAINRGKQPDLPPPSAIQQGADCVFLEVEESEEIPQKVAGVVAKSLPRLGYGRDDITVQRRALAPMQRGSTRRAQSERGAAKRAECRAPGEAIKDLNVGETRRAALVLTTRAIKLATGHATGQQL